MSIELFWALIGAAITLGVAALGAGGYQAVRWYRKRAVTAEMRAAVAMRVAGVDGVGTRSVDRIDITNIQDTGLTTQIKRYTFDLEFWWTDNAGTAHHYGPTQHVWPNDLADVPLRIVKQWAVELVIQAVRWRLGIDQVPEA